MGFSRQESWSGRPLPSLGYLAHPGIEPTSPALQKDSLSLSHLGSPIKLFSIMVSDSFIRFRAGDTELPQLNSPARFFSDFPPYAKNSWRAGGDVCVPVACSCWCIAETSTIVKSNYLPIKKEKEQLKLNIGDHEQYLSLQLHSLKLLRCRGPFQFFTEPSLYLATLSPSPLYLTSRLPFSITCHPISQKAEPTS